jgi:hypothetical protein
VRGFAFFGSISFDYGEKQGKGYELPQAHCERCGTQFPMRREWARFCSDKCRVRHAEFDKAIKVVNRYLATVNEAASIAGVSASTIRRWANRGQVRAKNHVGRVYIYREDLKLVNAQPESG